MESIRTERATTSRISDPTSDDPRRERRGRKRWRILRRRVGAFVLPIVAPTTLRLLARTWKVEVLGQENYTSTATEHGRLLALWHGRMLLPLHHHRGRDMCVLVSPSDDGSLVTRMLARFGQRVIRGSSNKASAAALRALLTELKQGGTVVLTPDGPRGPRHSMNQGLAWLSRATGFPILPCGFVCDRAWRASSWDRFTIPRPGARVALVYGAPIRVTREGGEDALAEATDEIRRQMLAAEERGFAHLGVESDW